MSRDKQMENYHSHAYYSSYFKKLNKAGLEFLDEFLKEFKSLDRQLFYKEVRSLWIGKEDYTLNNKPFYGNSIPSKQRLIINELLMLVLDK